MDDLISRQAVYDLIEKKERVMVVYLGECHLKIPCIDCDSQICANARKKAPCCPFYHCPTPELDCETECEAVDRIIESMRNEAKGESDDESGSD